MYQSAQHVLLCLCYQARPLCANPLFSQCQWTYCVEGEQWVEAGLYGNHAFYLQRGAMNVYHGGCCIRRLGMCCQVGFALFLFFDSQHFFPLCPNGFFLFLGSSYLIAFFNFLSDWYLWLLMRWPPSQSLLPLNAFSCLGALGLSFRVQSYPLIAEGPADLWYGGDLLYGPPKKHPATFEATEDCDLVCPDVICYWESCLIRPHPRCPSRGIFSVASTPRYPCLLVL